MNIRKANAKDRDNIIRLVRDGLREFDFEYSESTSEADLENFIEEYFKHSGVFLVLVDDQEEIIGTGAIREIEEGVYKIRKMYVDKSQQGQGYGKAILIELFKFARNAGAKAIKLETSTSMKAAIGLYKSFGFELSNEKPLSPRCDLTMTKTIDSG